MLQDEQYNQQVISKNLLEPILRMLMETMPRDSLLNSACLEFFEFIKRDNIKSLIQHLVDKYREKLQSITYVDTFQGLILRYEQMHEPPPTQELDQSFTSVDSDTPARHLVVNGGKWSQGLKDMDADEEAYYNASDDEEDLPATAKAVNGASPVRALVDYPDDEEEVDILASAPSQSPQNLSTSTQTQGSPTTSNSSNDSPPERISEKRRREDDEEDELIASLSSSGPKRRASLNSNSSAGSIKSLRRKNANMSSSAKENTTPKKITLSIPLKSGGEGADAD